MLGPLLANLGHPACNMISSRAEAERQARLCEARHAHAVMLSTVESELDRLVLGTPPKLFVPRWQLSIACTTGLQPNHCHCHCHIARPLPWHRNSHFALACLEGERAQEGPIAQLVNSISLEHRVL